MLDHQSPGSRSGRPRPSSVRQARPRPDQRASVPHWSSSDRRPICCVAPGKPGNPRRGRPTTRNRGRARHLVGLTGLAWYLIAYRAGINPERFGAGPARPVVAYADPFVLGAFGERGRRGGHGPGLRATSIAPDRVGLARRHLDQRTDRGSATCPSKVGGFIGNVVMGLLLDGSFQTIGPRDADDHRACPDRQRGIHRVRGVWREGSRGFLECRGRTSSRCAAVARPAVDPPRGSLDASLRNDDSG